MLRRHEHSRPAFLAALLGLLALLLLPAVHAMEGCGDDDDCSQDRSGAVARTGGNTGLAHSDDRSEPPHAPAHHHDESKCEFCRVILAVHHGVAPRTNLDPAPIALVAISNEALKPQRIVSRDPSAPRSSRGPPLTA